MFAETMCRPLLLGVEPLGTATYRFYLVSTME